ncbi:MAG: putative ABC exporter domain-containing protein [Armatimonadota bacterium]
MRAIVYLNLRLLLNSLRRTFTHPLRATVTVLIIAWFGFTFLGNLLRSDHVSRAPMPPDLITRYQDYLTALVSVLHLSILAPVFSPSRGFRSVRLFTQADVNFLFPSPLPRAPVFFLLLFSRGIVNSLSLLLILLIMVISTASELLTSLFFGNRPAHFTLVWAYPFMYLTAFFTLLGLGVLVLLKEEQREGFAKRARWATGAALALLAGVLSWHAYQAWLQGGEPLQTVVWHLLHNPVVAVPLLPARALAESAMVFATGWTPAITAGLVFWVVAWAGMVHLLMKHQHAFYDLAASIASRTTADVLRWQIPAVADYMSAVASAAQKPRKVARWRVFTAWRPQGAWALVWCHALLMGRLSAGSQALMGFLIPIVVMVAVFLFTGHQLGSDGKLAFALMIFYMTILFLTLAMQSWMVSVIHRAELNRSLPFSTRVVVLTEILLPSLFTSTGAVLLGILMVWLSPENLWALVCHTLIGISLVPILLTALLTLFLFLPDPSDYTQRVLLGFFMFPTLLLGALPAVGIASIGALLDLHLEIITLCIFCANAGMLWLALSLASYQYTRFNPHE